jgi:putative effector of murein hydrolase LrgA (UPF0299 family)
MLHFSRIEAQWLPILTALVVSTVLTVIVTAGVFRLLAPPGDSGSGPPE